MDFRKLVIQIGECKPDMAMVEILAAGSVSRESADKVLPGRFPVRG